MLPRFASLVLLSYSAAAQVYSPLVLRAGQQDTSNLASLAQGIFKEAGAQTDRAKAEAIWRFFLTDGRFAKAPMIYHIAGWAYEEPGGEVLDPVKLLNSYGFGLCYHIAPLLESIFKSGGFSDARVWFLTGHTVAEVFYAGAYHYFDSDMMGYNPIGTAGPLKDRVVASVRQLENDGGIMAAKLAGAKQQDVKDVDAPWYPADVHEQAIGNLAELFTSKQDNWVYPFQRYQDGHTLDFVLRPGERLVRYFHPEPEGLFYLPYQFDGAEWREFPQEIEQYKIRTVDGPRSQKDDRSWATGLQKYTPALQAGETAIYSMPCPYVIIDAKFELSAVLSSPKNHVSIETSVNSGHTWTAAADLRGPYNGHWTVSPAILTKSEHGSRNAVSGMYGYLVRITQTGATLGNLVLSTRFQFNPRTLPDLRPGENQLNYTSSKLVRWELPVPSPVRMTNVSPVTSGGQIYFANSAANEGDLIFAIEAPDGGIIDSVEAGGRFLDLREGFAPDKFTAEVRHVAPWPADGAVQAASLAWSTSLEGDYQKIWSYDRGLKWKDGDPIDRTLRWPEVDRRIENLPQGTRRVYLRYRLQGIALDAVRLSAMRSGQRSASDLQITHVWKENGKPREFHQRLQRGYTQNSYRVSIPQSASVVNEALIFESPAKKEIVK